MGRTVLCVDNDRNLCQVLAKALGAEGYDVSTEYDGERALAQLEQDPPDLVLLDVFLPGRDGFSVLEAIRQLPGPASHTPVGLLCGCSPTPEYSRRADALEALELFTKPVPIDKLVGFVATQIGEAKEPVPLDAEEAQAGRKAGDQELAGRLDQFPFPALLHHLHGLRASGVLHLAAGRKRKWVQLRDGYPVAVRSNLLNECLGNLLERSGRITKEQMDESHRRMAGGQLQGEILVAMELLSEEEVSQALTEQAEQKLFEIFSWKAGEFRFQFGGVLQKASGLAHRSPANLILQGIRAWAPLERIDAWLQEQQGMTIARGEKPFYRFQEVGLDAEQRSWVESLESTRSVAEFLEADEDLRRILYALVMTGILELRGGDGVRRPPLPPPGRPATPPSPREAASSPAPEEAQRAELTAMAERFANQNHFEILGVPETANEEEIRAAYEQLAELAHPDRVSTSSGAVKHLAEQTFRHVEQAYETLGDPRRRQEYLLERKRADRQAALREEGMRALSAERYFQQGEAALRQRAYETALRLFGRSLELYPEDGEYHAHYGWALHLCHPDNAQMAEEAIEHVKRGIKLASEREKPYLFMGRLCKATGRPGAAEKMFTRAVQIQPDCVEALRELRLINMRRQKEKGFIGRIFRR
jgi:CheY-like chemotaxis protein/curved DNA-binding protein CbpA